MIEYRICWSASSNASFHGASDWQEASPGETADEIVAAMTIVADMTKDTGGICDGLQMALEFSGFDWWVETRVGSKLIA